MQISHSAVPLGRRNLSLAHFAELGDNGIRQITKVQKSKTSSHVVNKWQVMRILAEIKKELKLSDRTLAVLTALASFYPQKEFPVTEQNVALIVFPSNRQLALRAHGMAEKTLRRHLAALVQGGLIVRRDSPNCKRYARKPLEGEGFSHAFGFDLSPLVMRFAEFERIFADAQQCRRQWKIIKEEISLVRRDTDKSLAILEAEFPNTVTIGLFRARFRILLVPTRRIHSLQELKLVADGLTQLKGEINDILGTEKDKEHLTVTDSQSDRHLSDSNTEYLFESDCVEMRCDYAQANTPDAVGRAGDAKEDIPLRLVVEACPDVGLFEPDGGKIQSWVGFIRAATAIRPMLGITAHAWDDARTNMGERDAAIAVGFILQRGEYSSEARVVTGAVPGSMIVAMNGSPVIKSPGGYLRSLTLQSKQGKLSTSTMLKALLGQRMKFCRERAATA